MNLLHLSRFPAILVRSEPVGETAGASTVLFFTTVRAGVSDGSSWAHTASSRPIIEGGKVDEFLKVDPHRCVGMVFAWCVWAGGNLR